MSYAGYALLCQRYGVSLDSLRKHSIICPDSRPRRTQIERDHSRESFPVSYQPEDDDFSQLVFALKYDGTDLLTLARLFPRIDRHELAAAIEAKPTSKYGRRLFFLYELLTGERLPLPDLSRASYCPVLEPADYWTASELRPSPRHRVNDNLLGDAGFCPVVRRTAKLKKSASEHHGRRATEMTKSVDPLLLARATTYLYTKETRSSFAIEREDPRDRLGRFVDALRNIASSSFEGEDELTELHAMIVDPDFVDRGYRRAGELEVYVGEVRGVREVVHHVGAPSELVPELMDAWARMRAVAGLEGAVIEAACRSFAFVFIHPFSDGNGRIHRLLLHHVLAKRGYLPANFIVPISAAIHEDRRRYDEVLEDFSVRLMSQIDYLLDTDARLTWKKRADDLYRYPDLTAQAEATFDWLGRAIEVDLVEELVYLRRFDQIRTNLRTIKEMPDRLEQQFIHICLQNDGRLSAKKRRRMFDMLDDETLARLEQIVRDALEDDPARP